MHFALSDNTGASKALVSTDLNFKWSDFASKVYGLVLFLTNVIARLNFLTVSWIIKATVETIDGHLP